MKKFIIFSLFVMVSVVNFSACTSNIQDIQPLEATVEKQKTYPASFEKVWTATQRALSENETFKILDKFSKIMVTEFKTIDDKKLTLTQTYLLLGKTYKSSYSINFFQHGPDKTDIDVNVKLQTVQASLITLEESNEYVAAYLRKNIFAKIESNLNMVSADIVDETPSINNQTIIEQTPQMTISEMQQRLLYLGYKPGPADGILGKQTIAALEKFQRDNNLPVTGNLNAETISHLQK